LNNLQPILAKYSFLGTNYQVASSGNARGFSGAEVWQIRFGQQLYCLKKWPTSHPSYERLIYIHRVLQHVSGQGLCHTCNIAVPLADDRGQTIVDYHGALFELTRWLPGEADFERRPSEKRLVAAMAVLARFHLMAATFCPIACAPSPGIAERREQLASLRSGGLEQITRAVRPRDWSVLAPLAHEFLELAPRVIPRIEYALDRVARWSVALQPCIRDVWHDHVLFTDDTVTGLIDFGSLRIENVAGDVARLIGSLVADEAVARQSAIRAYEELRPLSMEERELVEVFDQSTTLLGGINWLRWIYCDERSFADRARVEHRFTFLLKRLYRLVNKS
jgi:Ser/Thr protein kinase RdoA (MazF antagonist)